MFEKITPVKQDKFNHTFKWGGGNCLQASVATLLNLPLEAIPHFMLFGDKLWWDALILFMRSKGFDVLGWVEGNPPHDDKYYLTSMECGNKEFCHAVITKNGVIVHDPHPSKSQFGEYIAGYYSIKHLTSH